MSHSRLPVVSCSRSERLRTVLALCCLVCLSCGTLRAEEGDFDEDLYETDEDIDTAVESGELTTDAADTLKDIFYNKLDINTADETSLNVLPGIEPADAQRIVEDRKAHGPFGKIEDLVARRILSEDKIRKPKAFILADKPGVIRTRGEIGHVTTANIERAFATSSSLEGKAFSPTTDISFMKVGNIGKYFKFGTAFRGDNFTLKESISESDVMTTRDVRRYIWDRRYLGYDASATSESRPKGKQWLYQVYAGNFEIGWEKETSKGGDRSYGFKAKETKQSSLKTISLGSVPNVLWGGSLSGGSANVLDGMAASVGRGPFTYSGFYSKARYDAKALAARKSVTTGKVSLSSPTVEEVRNEELIGGSLVYQRSQDQQARFSWYKSGRSLTRGGLDDTDTYPLSSSFVVWRLKYRTVVKGVEGAAVFTRTENTGTGQDGLNSYYARMKTDIAKSGTQFKFAYQLNERNHVNPWFTGGGKDFWQYNTTLDQNIGKLLKVSFAYAEELKKNLPGQDLQVRVRWTLHRKASLNLGQIFSKKNVFLVTGADRSKSSTGANSSTSRAALRFKSGNATNEVAVTHKRTNIESADKFTVAQTYAWQCKFKFSDAFEITGGVNYADTDIYKPDTESQTFGIKFLASPSKRFKIQMNWQTKFQTKSQTVIVDGVEQDLDNPGSQNSVGVAALYKW